MWIWPWALAVTSIVAFLLTAKNRRVGWLILIANEVSWAVYASLTHQWGFILPSAFFIPIFAWNWRTHGRRISSSSSS